MYNFEVLKSEGGHHETVVFNANEEEIESIRKYFYDQKNKGKRVPIIVAELFADGWTKAELKQALPADMEEFYKERGRNNRNYIILIITIFIVTGSIEIIWQHIHLSFILVAPLAFAIVKILHNYSVTTTISTFERRVILFFSRFHKMFGIRPFPMDENYFLATKQRNQKKIFLPVKEESYFKAYGGHGKYKGKRYNIFIARKYSHTNGDSPIHRNFIFYEFEIKPVPFHFTLIEEFNFEPQSRRLQNENISEGDFRDINFPSIEFNKNWKLRGSDKKTAYQLFGPHMQALIMKINHKDFVGLEISDSSTMFTNWFTRYSVSRCIEDFKIAYEIARQVERNYRDVKWD